MTVQISAATGVNNGFEIFAGSCNGPMASCIITNSAGSGGITMGNYVVGTTYFIRVFNAGTTPINNSFNVCVLSPTMATEENGTEAVAIFPNPTDGILNVALAQYNGIYDYEVINQLGQAMVNGELVSQGIDVKKLPSGIYFLRIIARDGLKISTARFIKN